MPSGKKPEQVAAELARISRADVFGDIFHRAAYSTDASIYQIIPLCVVAPKDSQDVAVVVKYAGENNIPLVARGAGSGVAGEALCSGIVLDMKRYMNRVIDVADDGSTITSQPGAVLDELNSVLAGFGKKIGPDPSSGNRATVGGSVANNATGAHSLKFGYIADYVIGIEAVLADGSIVEFKNDFDPADSGDGKVARFAEGCLTVLGENADLIAAAQPPTKRSHSGYNIANISSDGRIDMARLLAGSEGTLAVFTKITLRTVDIPPSRVLLQLEFDSLEKMARAVPLIADSGASACELMDRSLMQLAAEAFAQYRDVLPTSAAVVLLVEYTGSSEQQVKQKIQAASAMVSELALCTTAVFDIAKQDLMWQSRKDAVPLLYRTKSRKRPIPFIEDTSVENARLAEYITGLNDIARRYDVSMAYYGHAGDGGLHIRPYMDLATAEDVRKMQSIATEVFSLAWSLGGSMSGEHADGLVRAAFIKGQYGDDYYEVLRKIKNIFDPDGLLNPGKIINDDADVLVSNLRAQQGAVAEKLETNLLFRPDEFQLEVEQCSGCGLCLSKQNDLRMCPVYRALGDELASSRAKANLIRFWLTGQLSEDDFESDRLKEILDLCINCKACSVQCPSGVDISKLVFEARAEYARRKGLSRAAFALSRNRLLSMLGSIFWPVSNFVMALPPFKWFLEKTVGLDRTRTLPRFEFGQFLTKGRKYLRSAGPVKNPVDKVVYFVDTFVNFNDHALGFAVLKVLRHNDIEVILPPQRPAPLPAMAYGDAKTARKDLEYNIAHLAGPVREGYKIVCSEPSAALCLKQEMRHFVAGEDAELISENTFELSSYLLGLREQNKLKPATKQITREFIYHLPCHLCALGEGIPSVKLLQEHCGVKVNELKSGCCGLAGTFGMQKKNYELSSQIAASFKEALEKSPVKSVLTECAACKMQIEHLSDKAVQHPIEILAKAYSIDSFDYAQS